MKDLTSRNRIFIISSISTLIYLVFQEIDFRILFNIAFKFDPIKPIILAIVVYLGAYWAMFYKISKERFITVLLFPSISIFALSLFLELLIHNVLSGVEQFSILVISLVIFWAYIYIVLLTVNILNTAYILKVPLEQAAKAVQFVLTLITAYIIFFILFSSDINIIIRTVLIMIICFLLTYMSLWTINLRLKQLLIASMNISLFCSFASIILNILPISPPYLALILSLMMYITLGISLEVRENIKSSIWIEYFALFVLVVTLVILITDWGINGMLL